MHHTQGMISSHPQGGTVNSEALTRCIEACFDCAQACTSCADACLAEADVQELRRCIRLNLDCADVCEVTGRVLSRLTEADPQILQRQLQACATACRACGEECERHAGHMEHCRVCAEACRACEEACNQMLSSLNA